MEIEAASANVPSARAEAKVRSATVSEARDGRGGGPRRCPPGSSVGGTPRWEVGEIPARGTQTLTLRPPRGVTAGRGDLTAEVLALDEPDWDSTPGNHDASEDDEAAKRFTVFAGGTQPTLDVHAVQVREGDDGERFARMRIGLELTPPAARRSTPT